MKKTIVILAAFFLFANVGHSVADDAAAPAGKQLFHVVSLKFKASATADQIKEVDDAFAALKTKIPGIQSLHWGKNISAEKREHGFAQCFIATFANEKDRDAYLVHPEHKAFGKIAGPVLDDVMVIDFWNE